MWRYNQSNELYHHGILGMKWGVRRTPEQLGRAKGETKKIVKDMSDDELRKTVNRLQLEKQYSQLSDNKVSKGKKYAQKIFKAGTTVAAVTTTAITLYNNFEKIKTIIEKTGGRRTTS